MLATRDTVGRFEHEDSQLEKRFLYNFVVHCSESQLKIPLDALQHTDSVLKLDEQHIEEHTCVPLFGCFH